MMYVKRRPRLGAIRTGLWACVFLGLSATAVAQDGPQPPLAIAVLTAGMHRIEAEVAESPREQMIGLMRRPSMAPNHGMLFVYEAPDRLCFWMRNTLLPLSIAFLDDEGRIVNIEDMKPLTEDSHCSAQPVRYALEMNQGWFAKRGMKPGFRLRGPFFQR